MVEISVQIVTRGESTLSQVLEALRCDRFVDAEVVVVDSSGRELPRGQRDRELIDQYLTTRPETSLLDARRLGVTVSRGPKSLLLDSTRVVSVGLLRELVQSHSKDPMVIIPEVGSGHTFWAIQGTWDKQIVNQRRFLERAIHSARPFVLPRYFDTQLLRRVYSTLLHRAGQESLSKVVYSDHSLVYLTALELWPHVAICQDGWISHTEDAKLGDVVRKYKRYGESSRVLKASAPDLLRAARSHGLDASSVGLELTRALVQPLHLMRFLSYMMGYVGGSLTKMNGK